MTNEVLSFPDDSMTTALHSSLALVELRVSEEARRLR